MKTKPYRRGLLIYPPHCALLFITDDERLQGLWANNPSDAQLAVFSFCCRRWIFDSRALLNQRCTALKALKASRLMSRFITASPPLLILATWWFITVLQSRSRLITSRFIRLGDAFRRSALLPFLSSGARGFQLAKAAPFPSAPGWLEALSSTYICVYVDVYTCITAIYI